MASDGWIPNLVDQFQEEKQRDRDGRVVLDDVAVEKPTAAEAPMAQPSETRNIGNCSVGITVREMDSTFKKNF